MLILTGKAARQVKSEDTHHKYKHIYDGHKYQKCIPLVLVLPKCYEATVFGVQTDNWENAAELPGQW